MRAAPEELDCRLGRAGGWGNQSLCSVRCGLARVGRRGGRDASRTSDRDEPLRPLLWLETLMSLAVTAPYRSPGPFRGSSALPRPGEIELVWRDLARGAHPVRDESPRVVGRSHAVTPQTRRRPAARRCPRPPRRAPRACRARAAHRGRARPRPAPSPAEGSTAPSAPSSSNRRDATRRPAPRPTRSLRPRTTATKTRPRLESPPPRTSSTSAPRRTRTPPTSSRARARRASSGATRRSRRRFTRATSCWRRARDGVEQAANPRRRSSWACAARGSSRGRFRSSRWRRIPPPGARASAGSSSARRAIGARGATLSWKFARQTPRRWVCTQSSGLKRREEGEGTTTTARTRC